MMLPLLKDTVSHRAYKGRCKERTSERANTYT